ncbi:MAG: hypothetical protein ACON4O_07765 [Lentimonas sp.]
MLRAISTILLACLCFYAGYTLGIKKIEVQSYETLPEEEPEVNNPEETAPEIAERADLATQVPDAPIDVSGFPERAQQKAITLTDSKARQLTVELLEVSEENLIGRRTYDDKILTIPISMLSIHDQAFAAYLFSQKNQKTAQEKIWEELFKDL